MPRLLPITMYHIRDWNSDEAEYDYFDTAENLTKFLNAEESKGKTYFIETIKLGVEALDVN